MKGPMMRILPTRGRLRLGALGAAMLSLVTMSAAAAASPSQVVTVVPSDSSATVITKAADVVPSERQLAWQRLEETAFLHFGVNTYDGREWGTGTENPNIFQPTGLNTDQWAASLKDAGFKEAILTAKHHDGFLLFPSKASTFSVAASSWAGGKGDVVKNFADSMHKYGLKVGIYLSPADLHENQSGGRFANGSARKPVTIPSDSSEVVGGVTFRFNSDDYNTYFENTLYELLTRYGGIDEIWWDNANPTNRNQPYSFGDWITMVRTLQPNAVIENDGGPDVRWVGNENGYARQSEWSVLPFTGDPSTAGDSILSVPGGNGAGDLGSNTLLSQRKQDGTSAWNLLKWSPGECNTTLSTNHNWFWHPGDTWRTEAQLEDLYYGSVGRNCNQLLDLGPNQQGLLDQSAVAAINQVHTALSSTFATDLASGAAAADDGGTSHTSGHTPDLSVDADQDSSWQPGSATGALVLTLPSSQTFDVISAQEDLHIGQRVTSYAVDAWNGSTWNQIASDTTIGYKKLIRLTAPVTTSQVRLRITGSRAAPAIAEIGLYHRPGAPSTTGAVTSGIAGKCMDANAAGNGAKVQLWDCNGGASQVWTWSGGTLTHSGKCMDVNGQGTANGTLVQLWDCNGGANQQWAAQSDGSLKSGQSGRCLDDPGAATANGTQLVIWDCNGGTNQKWKPPS